jgi:hypothetical protein
MSDNGNSTLRAGAAWEDITPALGVQIAGDIGRVRPTKSIRDPLHARALILEQAGTKLCILSTDAIVVLRHYSDIIRDRVAAELGMDRLAIMVHATQNHSGPAVENLKSAYFPSDQPWLSGPGEEYNNFFIEQCVKVAKAANDKLVPVTLKAGRTNEGRVASNRRFIRRDGTAGMHPGVDDPMVLCPEGIYDPEVGVAVLEDQNGKAVSAILHYTCHPCHGYDFNWISSDWPGLWTRGVRELLGEQCYPIVINGCCGNIHSRDHMARNSEDTMELKTSYLMESTEAVLPTLQPVTVDRLAWKQVAPSLPLRHFPKSLINKSRAYLAKHPTPVWTTAINITWDWMYPVHVLAVNEKMEKKGTYDFEVTAFRIGDMAIMSWPGEPFVELQVATKLKAPAKFVFGAHMVNDNAGYMPTKIAYEGGGYEVNWTRFPKGTLEKSINISRALLKDLYAD